MKCGSREEFKKLEACALNILSYTYSYDVQFIFIYFCVHHIYTYLLIRCAYYH